VKKKSFIVLATGANANKKNLLSKTNIFLSFLAAKLCYHVLSAKHFCNLQTLKLIEKNWEMGASKIL